MNKTVLIIIVIIVAAAGAVLYFSQNFSQKSPLDGFSKCLTEKNVTMYGAYWCSHCQNQKEMFGSSFKNINYVECSLPNRAGQTQTCIDAKISSYPTWEFADGSRIQGEVSVAGLRQKTGCPEGG